VFIIPGSVLQCNRGAACSANMHVYVRLVVGQVDRRWGTLFSLGMHQECAFCNALVQSNTHFSKPCDFSASFIITLMSSLSVQSFWLTDVGAKMVSRKQPSTTPFTLTTLSICCAFFMDNTLTILLQSKSVMRVLVIGCATFQPDGLHAALGSQRPAWQLARSALHHSPPSLILFMRRRLLSFTRRAGSTAVFSRYQR
jgi:hypothetical protein